MRLPIVNSPQVTGAPEHRAQRDEEHIGDAVFVADATKHMIGKNSPIMRPGTSLASARAIRARHTSQLAPTLREHRHPRHRDLARAMPQAASPQLR